MNRRQAKKKLKKDYGIITPRQTAPRQAAPRQEKRLTLSLIDYEAIEKLADDLRDCFKRLGEIIRDIIEKLGDTLRGIMQDNNNLFERPKKYSFIKNLSKPYTPPFIKIKARARANI